MESNPQQQERLVNQTPSKDIFILLIVLAVNGSISFVFKEYYDANAEEIRSWAIWEFRGINDFFKFGDHSFALPLFSIFMIPIKAIGPTIWLIWVQKKQSGKYILWGLFGYLNVWNALFLYFVNYINLELVNRISKKQSYNIEKLILFLIPVLFILKANSEVSYFLAIGLSSPLYNFFNQYFGLVVLGLIYFFWFFRIRQIQKRLKWGFAICSILYGTTTVLIYMVYDSIRILNTISKDSKLPP